jgi:hypothetical protein
MASMLGAIPLAAHSCAANMNMFMWPVAGTIGMMARPARGAPCRHCSRAAGGGPSLVGRESSPCGAERVRRGVAARAPVCPQATTVRVGNLMGEGRPKQAKLTGMVAKPPPPPPPSRLRPPATALGAQEIFSTANPYGKYPLGPDNTPPGDRARRSP